MISYTVQAAVESGEGVGLKILKKLDVIPKEGIRPLFSVYTMCRCEDQNYFLEKMGIIQESSLGRTRNTNEGEFGNMSDSDLMRGREGGLACTDNDSRPCFRDYPVERIVIRTARGERTEEYSQLLRDLGGYG